MKFLFRWTYREIKNDWKWTLIFCACFSMGLIGLVLIQNLRGSLEKSLQANAREILSADFSISSRRKILNTEIQKVRDLLGPQQESRVDEFFSMLSFQGRTRFVQVRAIDEKYPLYGRLELGSERRVLTGLDLDKFAVPSLWVYPEVLSQLGVRENDLVKLGDMEFQIQSTVERDTTQTMRLASLAPKVFFARRYLEETGLMAFGSTFSDQVLFQASEKTDSDLLQIRKRLEREVSDPNLQFSTAQDQAEGANRPLGYLLDYLGLVSMVGLALSLLGSGYLVQLFLKRRMGFWSLTRALGMTELQASNLLIGEFCLLGVFSGVWALAVVFLSQGLFHRVLLAAGLDLQIEMHLSTILLALSAGILFPLLTALPQIISWSRVSLKSVLIDRQLLFLRRSWFDFLLWIPLLVVFFAFCAWTAHSTRIAAIFVGLLILSFVALVLLVLVVLRSLPKAWSHWEGRHVMLELSRKKFRSVLIVVSLSFGSLLLVLLPQIQSSLAHEIEVPRSKLPSLFFFDIQDSQLSGLRSYFSENSIEAQNLSALIRARILSINGIPFERVSSDSWIQTRESQNEDRFRNRGLNLTFRPGPTETEEIVEGRGFSPQKKEVAEISVEKGYAAKLGLHLGDQVVFDIQGAEVKGVVVNFRSVQWTSFRPNFFVVIQPGFLEEAPKTWILSLPALPKQRAEKVQAEVSQKFVNISVIDVSHFIHVGLESLDKMSWALNLMALLSVFVGLVVMGVILFSEFNDRLVDLNLYRALGASMDSLRRMIWLENLILTLMAGAVGTGLGLLVSFVLMRLFFELSWVLNPPAILLGLFFPPGAALGLSFLVTRRLRGTSATSLLQESRL